MLALPGAAYLYQGEELGLPEVTDLPAAARRDPTFWRTSGAQSGRDGCRVPMPWMGGEPSYGFGPTSSSWLPQPSAWAELSALVQDDDLRSTLNLYRDALRLRKELPWPTDEPLSWLDSTPDVLAFRRGQDFTCIVNFGDTPVSWTSLGVHGEVVLASDARHQQLALVPADVAVWIRGRHRATVE